MKPQSVANDEIAILEAGIRWCGVHSGNSPSPDAAHDLGDAGRVGIVPHCEAQPQEDVRAHHCPGDYVQILIGKFGIDLTFFASTGKARRNTLCGCLIMFTISCRIDELGLVDNPIDVTVIADETEEC